ncbi:MAG: hypothetical protein GY795_18625 [Desulfobacterales bacterium]|nr:hypothetical protein [Desulfobacterales bacterium]
MNFFKQQEKMLNYKKFQKLLKQNDYHDALNYLYYKVDYSNSPSKFEEYQSRYKNEWEDYKDNWSELLYQIALHLIAGALIGVIVIIIMNNEQNSLSSSGNRAFFVLTEQSLGNLKNDGNFPEDINDELIKLKNKIYTNEVAFLDILEKTIGKEQTGKYKSSILEHTKKEPIEIIEDQRIKLSKKEGIIANKEKKIKELNYVLESRSQAEVIQFGTNVYLLKLLNKEGEKPHYFIHAFKPKHQVNFLKEEDYKKFKTLHELIKQKQTDCYKFKFSKLLNVRKGPGIEKESITTTNPSIPVCFSQFSTGNNPEDDNIWGQFKINDQSEEYWSAIFDLKKNEFIIKEN